MAVMHTGTEAAAKKSELSNQRRGNSWSEGEGPIKAQKGEGDRTRRRLDVILGGSRIFKLRRMMGEEEGGSSSCAAQLHWVGGRGIGRGGLDLHSSVGLDGLDRKGAQRKTCVRALGERGKATSLRVLLSPSFEVQKMGKGGKLSSGRKKTTRRWGEKLGGKGF